MKIAFFETEPVEEKYLKEKLSDHELAFFKEPLNEDTMDKAEGFDIVSTFIYSKITEKVVKYSSFKLLCTRSTGFDHINLNACKGVVVCNVPYYGENTVAEHTFALILALSRNIHKTYVRTIRKDFSLEGLRGFDLKDKTLGVVGCGRIGLHVIKIAKGFGMNVVAYDINKDKFLSEILMFDYVSLDEVLEKSDVITLHVPLNKHTHHMINSENIEKIKPGAILINTARGSLIETQALVKALDEGIIGGAGLDVFEGEEVLKEDKQFIYEDQPKEKLRNVIQTYNLLERENVVITPHNAFNSHEAVYRILDTTISNIESFLAGECQNRIIPNNTN